jgi:glycosyltransferase involved in cell wall biosynthesis
MIVKNESKIIERCLNSAKPIIDYVSILDTGSTDQTPEIIENWCKENSILGTIHYEAFKNFGYNRSLAVTKAQETYPESDYLLLLDADMILEINPDFDNGCLNKNKYQIMQFTTNIKYWNTRLIKTCLPWKCFGVTHEYWDLDNTQLTPNQFSLLENGGGKLESLVINDQGDGGSKKDKFTRDKKLLIEGINDPSTSYDLKVRYMFYLAQTLYAINELEESIHWYKKRIEEGGWAEEVFYSMLQIGLCYESLANQHLLEKEQIIEESKKYNSIIDRSIPENLDVEEERLLALSLHYLNKSWEFRPVRAEPLYHIAKIYRKNKKYHLGLMYALQGQKITFPKNDILFVNYHVYEYFFDYEISICAYYIEGQRNLGHTAQKHLESKIDHLPENIAKVVLSNAKYY